MAIGSRESGGEIADCGQVAHGEVALGCILRVRGGAIQLGARWSEAAEPAAAIDEADITVVEAHDVIAGFELGGVDQFADQGFADEDITALPSDLVEPRSARPPACRPS